MTTATIDTTIHHDPFLQAIWESRTDPRTWSVYADWLAEQGESLLPSLVLPLGLLQQTEVLKRHWPSAQCLLVRDGHAYLYSDCYSYGHPSHRCASGSNWVLGAVTASPHGLLDEVRGLIQGIAAQRDEEARIAAEAKAARTPADLLGHPETRQAAYRLARGEAANHVRLSDLARRPVIAVAKARLADRLARRAAHQAAEVARAKPSGQVRAKYLARLRANAVALGQAYHREVKSLYASRFGEVLYGRGGQSTCDGERYSKKYHRSFGPASNLNAGARLDSEDQPTCVILENFRGTHVATIPLKTEPESA